MRLGTIKVFFSTSIFLLGTSAAAQKMDVPHKEVWIPDTIKEIVPKDPEENGESSLAGIDSDSDGIRDDIELYILNTYSNEEQKFTANSLLLISRFFHALLVSTGEKPDFTPIYTAMYLVPRQCILNDFPSIMESRNAVHDVHARMTNTLPRIHRYLDLLNVLDEEYVHGRFLVKHYKNRGELINSNCRSDPQCRENWDKPTQFCRGGENRNNMSTRFQ